MFHPHSKASNTPRTGPWRAVGVLAVQWAVLLGLMLWGSAAIFQDFAIPPPPFEPFNLGTAQLVPSSVGNELRFLLALAALAAALGLRIPAVFFALCGSAWHLYWVWRVKSDFLEGFEGRPLMQERLAKVLDETVVGPGLWVPSAVFLGMALVAFLCYPAWNAYWRQTGPRRSQPDSGTGGDPPIRGAAEPGE